MIDQYIVDFYCHDDKLILELDGSQHYEENELEKEKKSTQNLEKRHLKVIRIPNNEVNHNFSGVCEYIDHIVKLRIESPSQLR